MKGMVYLFRKLQSEPVSSAEVDIPDDADDDHAVLIAAHKLMKDFKVELFLEENREVNGKRTGRNIKKGQCKNTF